MERQHDLEKRLTCERALGLQRMDYHVERYIPVHKCFEIEIPHSRYQFAKRWISGYIGPQNQGVHEKPDQFFESLFVAPGDWRSQWNIFPCAEP